MQYAYSKNQSAPSILQMQIGVAMPNAGVPVEVAAAGTAGIALATTIAAVDCVGVTQDSQATLVTAQQSDNSDPERMVTVVTNDDAVFFAWLSGGSSDGTALDEKTVTTASTTGLDVVTTDDFTNFDEGTIWCYSGANAGIARRIGVGDATDATVVVAFPFDTAIGDVFLVAPYGPPALQYVQLTTTLTQLDASAAVDIDNANFSVIELSLLDIGGEGKTMSGAYIKPVDMYSAGRPT